MAITEPCSYREEMRYPLLTKRWSLDQCVSTDESAMQDYSTFFYRHNIASGLKTEQQDHVSTWQRTNGLCFILQLPGIYGALPMVLVIAWTEC